MEINGIFDLSFLLMLWFQFKKFFYAVLLTTQVLKFNDTIMLMASKKQ